MSRKAYRGINQFFTALVGIRRGYLSPYWVTFKQARDLGGTLEYAKGQGVPIVFFKHLDSAEGSEAEEGKRRFVARCTHAMNAARRTAAL